MKELYNKYSKQFKVAGLGICDIVILNLVSILVLRYSAYIRAFGDMQVFMRWLCWSVQCC